MFPFHVAALEAGLACAVLEDGNKIVSCVEEDAVAPSASSHPSTRQQELEDGRKVPGCEKDDATQATQARSLKTTATLPAGTSANSRRRPHVVE